MQAEAVNQLVPFQFESMTIRALAGDDAEPLFLARDVALALGYSNINDAIARHCKGVVKRDLPSTSGTQSFSMIPERDVYRLVMRSKLPSAERFEEWVVGEVLPSIRKKGSYSVAPVAPTLPDFTDPVIAARAWADQVEKSRALQITLAEQAPKADFYDKYTKAEGNKGIREVAKLLHANEREFVDFLISHDFMYRLQGRLTPHARHHHAHRFEVKAGLSSNDHAFSQAMFTPRGVTWIAAEWAKYQAVEHA